jgi:hypothetical protein
VNPVLRFEAICARAVEGTFARIFPSALEPEHVGRKLIAAQAATPTDTYLVRVHPVDHARFAADRTFLEARWSAMLRENAPGETPRAVLVEDSAVVAGAVAIEALIDERPPELTLVRGDERTPLRDGLTIGRSDENDVVLHDGRVSRRHARIVADGEGFAVVDLDSSNGTFVDGVRVTRRRLVPGETIVVGDTMLAVRA